MSLFCNQCNAITRNRNPRKMSVEEINEYNQKIYLPFNKLEANDKYYYFTAECQTCGNTKIKRVRLMTKTIIEDERPNAESGGSPKNENKTSNVEKFVEDRKLEVIIDRPKTPEPVLQIETKSEVECLKEEVKNSCLIEDKPKEIPMTRCTVKVVRDRHANLLGIKKC